MCRALAAFSIVACLQAAAASENVIVLQSTTSTQNSGLYDAILPEFSAQTGIEVRVVAVGSGQALRNAADCNGEVVIVHHPAAEQAFLDAGHANQRFKLMRNDFVIVGPGDDPAVIGSTDNAELALARIAAMRHPFVSRGDDSGTHSREIKIWQRAGIAPAGSWYRETGAGMGATLNIAVGMDAYALTDRSTWIRFGNKLRHWILFEGGPDLSNQYSIMKVDDGRCRGLNADAAQLFTRWMLSPAGQRAIGAFTVSGTQLFEPNAAPE